MEKAEKMYAQMYSTREKVRAAPRWGNRVLLVRTPWGVLSSAEPVLRALRKLETGRNEPSNLLMV